MGTACQRRRALVREAPEEVDGECCGHRSDCLMLGKSTASFWLERLQASRYRELKWKARRQLGGTAARRGVCDLWRRSWEHSFICPLRAICAAGSEQMLVIAQDTASCSMAGTEVLEKPGWDSKQHHHVETTVQRQPSGIDSRARPDWAGDAPF